MASLASFSLLTILLAVASLAGLGLAQDASSAAGTSTNQPALPAFRLMSTTQAIAAGVARQALVLQAGSNRFTFMPPAGWKAREVAEEKRVYLTPGTNDILLTLTFQDGKAQEARELTAETVKGVLLDRFPGATVTGEFSPPALSGPGTGFDLEWRSPTGPQQLRACVAPFPGGQVEAILTTHPADFTRHQRKLNSLLLSLRLSPATGRLELQPAQPE